jgi:protein TonB
MKRDLLIGASLALLIHAGLAFSGDFFKGTPAPVPVDDSIPIVELAPLPPAEPEPIPLSSALNSGGGGGKLSDIVPPMQADTPSPTASAFVQRIQPPPPAGLQRSTGALIIPERPGFGSGTGGTGSGFQNLFDLASLDQAPAPRGPIRPRYPDDMSRAGTNGEVVIGFIVDSEGNVQNPYVVSSTHRAFEAEALRAVARTKFKPGRKDGAHVSTSNVRIPIIFKISED